MARQLRLRGWPSLVEFIRQAPSFDLLDLERASDTGRVIDRNTADFEGCDVRLLDPWQRPSAAAG